MPYATAEYPLLTWPPNPNPPYRLRTVDRGPWTEDCGPLTVIDAHAQRAHTLINPCGSYL